MHLVVCLFFIHCCYAYILEHSQLTLLPTLLFLSTSYQQKKYQFILQYLQQQQVVNLLQKNQNKMRKARPYKPAPKNASANRIRERYLHQLGLQRGVVGGLGGGPLSVPHGLADQQQNHIVVISGLPSLPEDRATTTNEHVMECHDFSISRHSQHSVGGGTNSIGDYDNNMNMESGDESSELLYGVHRHQPGDAPSHCSKSTLSRSPSATSIEADQTLTSMALAYPTAVLKMPPPAKPTPPPSNNNTLPFSLSPWRNSSSSLSKSASAVLLETADHDSVSSVGTSTTAESSLIARDWSATIPHSASSQTGGGGGGGGESPASTPGVYFQPISGGSIGGPRLLATNWGSAGIGQQQQYCVTTSSLANALNRFNIDSDCEASVASTSIAEDHTMDEDDASSVASHTSSGSQLSSSHNIRVGRKKKIGSRTQRLMDRAAAHERILQIRNDHSQKMRANLVHSQRMMGVQPQVVNMSGISSMMMPQDTASQQLDESVRSTSSICSQGSIPLVHMNHGSGPSSSQVLPSTPRGVDMKFPLHSMGDLGRTPTASNCASELRRDLKTLGLTSYVFPSLPVGVHHTTGTAVTADDCSIASTTSAPLEYHPQLASRFPSPPPKLAGMMLEASHMSSSEVAHPIRMGSDVSTPTELMETNNETTEGCGGESLQHVNHHNHQASVDDIMEVAMTLSKLKGNSLRSPGSSIPRIR